MPRNSRPPGLFGELNYGWEDSTLSERIQAQNTWDLLEAQEKANKLKERELDILEAQKINNNVVSESERNSDIANELKRKRNQKVLKLYGIDEDAYFYLLGLTFDPKIFRAKMDISDLERDINRTSNILNNFNNGNFTELVAYLILILPIVALISYFININGSLIIPSIVVTIFIVAILFILLKYDKKFKIKSQLKNLNKELQQTYSNLDKLKYDKQEPFYNFRCNHYNKEVELALSLLELDIKSIRKQDIIAKGDVDDYNEFFKTQI